MDYIYEDYDPITFGKIIKALRMEMGLSREKFIEGLWPYGLSMSVSTLKKWEGGDVNPALSDILKLCNVFDCEIDFLLGKQNYKIKKDYDVSKATGLTQYTSRLLTQYKAIDDKRKAIDNLSNIEIIELVIKVMPNIIKGMHDIILNDNKEEDGNIKEREYVEDYLLEEIEELIKPSTLWKIENIFMDAVKEYINTFDYKRTRTYSGEDIKSLQAFFKQLDVLLVKGEEEV